MPRLRSLRSTKRRDVHRKKLVRLVFAWIFAILSVSAAVVFFFNSRFFRISSIMVKGGNAASDIQIQSIVQKSISGDYFWFIPKDSFFFFPSKKLSSGISAEFPFIAAISFHRQGFTGVAVETIDRVPYAIVCIGSGNDDCYYSDENGVMFENVPSASIASTTYGTFIIYRISLPDNAHPIGIDFLDSGRLQTIGAFVDGLAKLGLIDDNVTVSTSTNYDLALQDKDIGYRVEGIKKGKTSELLASTKPYTSLSLSDSQSSSSLRLSESNDLNSTPSSDTTFFATTSIHILHLLINESRPLSETFDDFSAFWQEYMAKATSTSARDLSLVDMRYGDNIIYKIR